MLWRTTADIFAFISRSAGLTADNHRLSLDFGSLGCSVFAVTGQIENMEDVRRDVAAPSRAIKGVIHFAEILRVCVLDHEAVSQVLIANVGRVFH